MFFIFIPKSIHPNCFLFQPTRLIIHVVYESSEVPALYTVAQLQMDDPEDPDRRAAGGPSSPLLLRNAGIHCQENFQRINTLFANRQYRQENLQCMP